MSNTESNGRLIASSSQLSENEGYLEASILSVDDLPYPEPPVAVTLAVGRITVNSGPPVSRHRDRNSFRFNAGGGNSSGSSSSESTTNTTRVVAPLRELYSSTLVVRIVYANKSQLLETSYELKQLRIQESKWLILNFLPDSSSQALTNDEGVEDVNPSIRLKLCLCGPYRPEFASIVALGKAWFGLVDHIEMQLQGMLTNIPRFSSNFSKYLALPLVPAVTVAVVTMPVVLSIGMVSLPFLLPVFLFLIVLVIALLSAGGLLYGSTRYGRAQIGEVTSPLLESFLHSRAGQRLVYNTGPRPTPVSVSKQILPREMWAKLIVSLFIDLLGSSSYLLPVVGEGVDLAWAPIQTVLIMAMYDQTTPNLKYVSFVEEILPFTDIVPSATIGWGCEFLPSLVGMKPGMAEGRPPSLSSRSSSGLR